MGKADFLSRRPDLVIQTEENNNVTLLKPEFFKIRALELGHSLITAEESEILKEIRKNMDKIDEIVKTKKNPQDWSEEQGLTLFKGKVYVPLDWNLQTKLTKLHHDSSLAGHPGKWRTYELITRNYWWPGITTFISNYIKGCDLCQRTKTQRTLPSGKLVLDTPPSRP